MVGSGEKQPCCGSGSGVGRGRIIRVDLGLLFVGFCVFIVILYKRGAGGIIQTFLSVLWVSFAMPFPCAGKKLGGSAAALPGACPWRGAGPAPPSPPKRIKALERCFSTPSRSPLRSGWHQSHFLTDCAGAEDVPGEGQLWSAAPGAGTAELAPAGAEALRVFSISGTQPPRA